MVQLTGCEEYDERVDISQGKHDRENSNDDEQNGHEVDKQPRNQQKTFFSGNS
jgi:hypothetical protein